MISPHAIYRKEANLSSVSNVSKKITIHHCGWWGQSFFLKIYTRILDLIACSVVCGHLA